jgi:hypothetical protein
LSGNLPSLPRIRPSRIRAEIQATLVCSTPAFRFKKYFAFLVALFTGTAFCGYHEFGAPNVNRLIWLVCGIFLLMSPRPLLAQRRGGQGAVRPSTRVPDTDDPTGFKRAVALQATPDQVIQFRQLTSSTQVARKHAQDLLQLAEDASKLNVLHTTNPLTSAVEDAQTN